MGGGGEGEFGIGYIAENVSHEERVQRRDGARGGRSSGERRVDGWVEMRGALLINWIVSVRKYIICISVVVAVAVMVTVTVTVTSGDHDGWEWRSIRCWHGW